MRYVKLPVAVIVALLLASGSYFVVPVPAATVGPVTDPIGVVKVNKGQPITIAYWLVIAGPDASLGIDSRRGIEIAIDDKKKVAGFSVKLIGEDSGCNAEGGVTAATKLAANKAIVAAIGSSCSSEARPGAPILWKAGIVTVSPSNTAPVLTAADRGPDYGGYMRTAHNDSVQGKVAAEFAFKVLKVKKAATIHDGSPYAEGLANVFGDVFTRLAGAGAITAREAISPTDTDMRPVLTKIAATKPDLVYFPIFIAAGGFVVRQAKEVAGLANVKLMSADGTFSPDFRKAAGDAVVGVYNSSPDLTKLGPGYAKFLEKHQKKYGEKPLSAFHPHAYDAAVVIFAAIEKVGKKDAQGNLYIGRQALRDALFATKNFKGLTGTLTCNQFGDCADPKIAVYVTVSADPAKWNPGTDPKQIYP